MKPYAVTMVLVLLATPSIARQDATQKPPASQDATQKPPAGQDAAQKPAPAQGEAVKPAQGEAVKTAPAQGATPAAQTASFSNEKLEQLVAPIALYPDALLAQILMGSTYPLEIVEAARWLQKNPGLKSDKLEAALKDQTWDPSVKSLCGFGDVVKRMNDNLDWTQDLGDAFLGQKKELMDTVQTMRRKAFDAGNLKTSKEIKVTEQADKIIIVEAAQPEVIYVPTYYPTAVYGGWGYPTYYYPPMYPPYPPGAAFFTFTAGVVWGAAIWGNCNWGGSDVDIDINKQNNFIDRTENGGRRDQVKDRANAGTNKGKFQHNPEHRKGVGYKDSKVAQNFGGSPGQSRVSKDQARGFSDRGGAQSPGGSRPSASTRDSGAKPSAGAKPSTRPSTTPSRSSSKSSSGSGSFSGSRSPSADRAGSSRGASSRGSSGARGGGSRGGGGGGRGRR